MRSTSKKLLILLLVLLLSFSAIFFSFQKWFGFSGGVANTFISAPASYVWTVSGKISKFFSFLFNIRNIYSENTDYKNQNQRLMSENYYLKDFILEKNMISQAKDLQIKENFEWQIGRVIGVDVQNWSGYIILNVGEDDGIRVDMPVINENKFLVGRISEVGKRSSKIMTIFNPMFKTMVKTQDGNTFGILKGDYTKNLSMDLISKDEELGEDEVILTSGKDGISPPNLIVGKIKNFQITPENLFQIANVQSDINIYELDRILVITKF